MRVRAADTGWRCGVRGGGVVHTRWFRRRGAQWRPGGMEGSVGLRGSLRGRELARSVFESLRGVFSVEATSENLGFRVWDA